MRCYVENNLSKEGVEDYIQFLEDVFNAEFVRETTNTYGFLCFKTFDKNSFRSYLLVRGENYKVMNLIKNISINEKNIIIISCTVEEIVKLTLNYREKPTKNKLIYYPKYSEDGKFTTKYDGEIYGLKFDPCKSELLLGDDSTKLSIYQNLMKNLEVDTVRKICDR